MAPMQIATSEAAAISFICFKSVSSLMWNAPKQFPGAVQERPSLLEFDGIVLRGSIYPGPSRGGYEASAKSC